MEFSFLFFSFRERERERRIERDCSCQVCHKGLPFLHKLTKAAKGDAGDATVGGVAV
jgi:hypothetical protein